MDIKKEKITNPELMMSHHGKSFHFASQVFSQKVFFRISYLYCFCRYVDDTADEQEAAIALKELTEIKNYLSNETKHTYENTHESKKLVANEIYLTDLIAQLQQFGIKKNYLSVLVDGALFDVNSQKIETTQDLLRYCYHVAGVVGLMMCPLIFVRNKLAYSFAIDLGIGMQLTNICRDVLEDAQNNRTYLPGNDLKNMGLNLQMMQIKGPTPESLKTIVQKYLDLADIYYKSSFLGISYIPFRPRIAILFALEIYRSIGLKLKTKGLDVLQGRVYLSRTEKVYVCLKALIKVFHIRFWYPSAHNSKLHKPLIGLPEITHD